MFRKSFKYQCSCHHVPKYSLLFLILLLGFFSAVHPQSKSRHSNLFSLKIPSFEHLSIERGLSQSTINCILQDRKGFLWFGTEDGLNRYDGYHFTIYRPVVSDSKSISHNYIWALHEDHRGYIWIGTNGGGLSCFDPTTESFVNYMYDPNDPMSICSNFVRVLYEDSSGQLWIGTENNGLLRLDLNGWDKDKRVLFVHYKKKTDDSHSLNDNHVRSVYQDSTGTLWIGTGSGLNHYDRVSDKFEGFTHSQGANNSLIRGSLWAIQEDHNHNFWIGSAHGLFRFNPKNKAFSHINLDKGNTGKLVSTEIRLIIEDRSGLLWIGTNSHGLFVMNPEEQKYEHVFHRSNNPTGLSSNEIRSLHEDRSGIVWIGTEGKGLNKYISRKLKFVRYNKIPGSSQSLNNDLIWAIYEDRSGILWIGTNGGGLNRMDRSRGVTTCYTHNSRDPGSLSDNIVKTICQDHLGKLWVGTENGGLNLFNPQNGSFTHYRNDYSDSSSLSNDFIRIIFEDSFHNLWVGTSGGGLNKFNRNTKQFKRYQHDPQKSETISHDDVYSIYEDSKGVMWIGTWGGGLNKYHHEKDVFVRYQSNPTDPLSLSHNLVLCIHEDKSGRLWVGTSGGGLNLFDSRKETFTHFNTNNGLANNVIYGILEDQKGNLWMSTNKGITKFNPDTLSFHHFTVNDGLQNNEFNGNSYFKSRLRQEMFFGGISGFNSFFPDKMKTNEYVPPVVVTSFLKFNKKVKLPTCISEICSLTLSHKDYLFSFEFTALDYTAPEKNLYAYKLEGLDKEWIYTDSSRRFASYTTLPSGKYTFKVRGSNSDGLWNREGASIELIIRPPFWATWWFRVAVLGMVLLLMVMFYKYRIFTLKRRSSQLESINRALNTQIKKREKVEIELQKSESKYRSLTENISLGIFRNTPTSRGKFLEFNPALMKIFGYSDKAELFKISVADLYRVPDDRKKFNQKMKKYGQVKREELELKRKDGTPIWCSVSAVAVYDKKGNIIYYDGLIEDITERKLLDNRIRQSLKMEAVGKLAGGIAHDFNNILTVIHGHTELALMKSRSNDSLKRHLNDILKSSKRANDLVFQLLAFSRKQIIEPSLIDVNKVILNLNKMLQRLIREDIRINTELRQNLPLIKADSGQIEQIFMNLVINARDSIDEIVDPQAEKIITLETDIATLDDHYVRLHPGSRPGPHVVISVSDTGKGMTEEVKEQIFEPFFTTKPDGKGIGLGLSTIYGIVKQNNGTIYVYTEPGRGTTFKIYWPYSEDQSVPKIIKTRREEFPAGKETVLVVEDNPDVRNFICDTLVTFGYTVHEASNGKKALEMIKNEQLKIDMLITDVVMPEMGGREVAEKIQNLIPEVKILFTSGYTSNHIVHNGVLEKGINFINKPFSIHDLLSKVRQVMEEHYNQTDSE